MQENLVLTSACARTYVRPSAQTLGDGEGSPKAARPGEENVIFSCRKSCGAFGQLVQRNDCLTVLKFQT